jgi:hypothetical protein
VIYGIAGDAFGVTMNAEAFTPAFGIYDERDRQLAVSPRTDTRTASHVFVVPASGWYWIAATSELPGTVGDYTINVECATSGCLPPLLLNQPKDIAADPGRAIPLALDIDAVGPLKVQLRDAGNDVVAESSSAAFTIPATVAAGRYVIRVETPCGEAVSRVFTITRGSAAYRRRSTHH